METIEKPIITEPVKKRNPLLIVGVLSLFIIFIIFSIALLTSPKTKTNSVQISPTPNTQATGGTKKKPSSLALDLTFVQLESDLKNLDQDLTNADLTEPKLTMPILEMNVLFVK